MARYIIKRVLWMIPVMLMVVVVVFTITYVAPGDPVIMLLGPENNTPEAYAKKAAELGLDKNHFVKGYFIQLGTYIWNLVTKLDLGKSLQTNIPVARELAARLPITFTIGILGMLLMMAIGLPLGILSALKQYSVLDTTLTSISLIFTAVPPFVLSLLCALLFGRVLQWLPLRGIESWKSWVLPVFCSAAGGIAIYMRMTRTTMLEVIRQDYIRTARSKGLSEGVVIRKHALINCLIPLTTVIGTLLANMFSGSIIVETIFSINGMGIYLMSGIIYRDYPIINGSVVFISLLICIVNLLNDIAFAFIDPRIRAQFVKPREKPKKTNKRIAQAAICES